MTHEANYVEVQQVASWLLENHKILILDTRAFMDYNTSHIDKSINIGGDRVFRRKLRRHPYALSHLITDLAGLSFEEIYKYRDVVIYDQCSDDQEGLESNAFFSFILETLSSNFPSARFLRGGFLGFQAAYPELCWEHSEKLPGEEYVHIQKNSGLEAVLDRCLGNIPFTRILAPYCRLSSASNSSYSCSCAVFESTSLSDSGVGSSSASSSVSHSEILQVISLENTCRNSDVTPSLGCVVSRTASDPAPQLNRGLLGGPSKTRSPDRPVTLTISSSMPIRRSFQLSPSARVSGTIDRLPPSPFRRRRPGWPSSTGLADDARTPSKENEDIFLPVKPLPPPLHVNGVDFTLPPTRILPHVVVGCQSDANSATTCREYGITHVINVSVDGPPSPHVPPENFLRIPIHDNFTDQITPYFDRAFIFINSARFSNGCVLIHCAAGISRSPSLAIAYLMQSDHLTLDEAYKQVRTSRPSVSPNFNFLGQLTAFENQLTGRLPSVRPRAFSSECAGTSPLSAQTDTDDVTAASPNATQSGLSLPKISNHRSSSESRPFWLKPYLTETPRLCCTVVHRPSLRLGDPIATSGSRLASLIKSSATSSQKRERPKQLSLLSLDGGCLNNDRSAVTTATFIEKADEGTPSDVDALVAHPSRRKRSRIIPLPPIEATLPSPCSGIAGLNLSTSSCSEDRRRRLVALPTAPSAKFLKSEETSTDSDIDEPPRQRWPSACTTPKSNSVEMLPAAAEFTCILPTSSSRSRHSSTSSVISKSASNPLISRLPTESASSLTSLSYGVSPSSTCCRALILPTLLGDASCRRQESCHLSTSSSLSSSSNGHTPSLPIS